MPIPSAPNLPVSPNLPTNVPSKVVDAQVVLDYIRSKGPGATQDILVEHYFDDLLTGKSSEDQARLQVLINDIKAKAPR